MELTKVRKKRALSTDAARAVRQKGYDDALEFALAIGLTADYKNNPQSKKDVIDPSGDAHSVKSGEIKWQIFLYRSSRFGTDDAFVVMNGIGELLSNCIECFPQSFDDYIKDKISAKKRLQIPMRKLAEKLREKSRLRAFLRKSLFNGEEVDYLTVKQNGLFHVFLNEDVIDTLGENLAVGNSKKRAEGQMDDQKVVFKYNNVNLGELEMRNDTFTHYKEIRFNMIKPKVVSLLLDKIPVIKEYSAKVFVHGNASRVFGRWTTEEVKTYIKETSV